MTGDRDLGGSEEMSHFIVPISGDQTDLPVPQVFSVIERTGFTPQLTRNLRSLNDTMARIRPSEVAGFNLELTPDALTPKVDFKQEVKSPFKVEVVGHTDGSAALRISVTGEVWGDNVLFSDIKDFVQESFPDRKATFHTAPTIEFQGEIYLRRYGSPPRNLYEYEQDPSWGRDIERARRERAESYLKGVLPEIDVNLDEVTNEQIAKLTERIEGADITITFYSRYRQNPKNRRVNRKEGMTVATWPQLYTNFEIRLDGQQEPFLQFDVISVYSGKANCVFSKLFFRGKPEEVEQIMEKFTGLLQKTPAYKRSTENPNS